MSAAPVLADDAQTPPAQTAQNQPADPLDQIVCHAGAKTGSRIASGRVCKTQREWNDRRAQDRQNLDKTQVIGANPDATNFTEPPFGPAN